MIVTTASDERFVVYQLGERLEDICDQLAELALENNAGNITKAAKSLGLYRTTLAMRLRRNTKLMAKVSDDDCD